MADEHHAVAESFLRLAGDGDPGTLDAEYYLQVAQIHATLATLHQQPPHVRRVMEENRVLQGQVEAYRNALRDVAPKLTAPADDRPKPGPPPNLGVPTPTNSRRLGGQQ